MVRVTVGVHHGLNRKAFVAGEVQIGMEVAERIDDDRFPVARDHVAQTASRRPAYLKDGQVGAFDHGAGCVELAPGFHPALEVGAGIIQPAQPLRDEFRSAAFGAYSKDGQIRGKLVRQVLLKVSDDGFQHVVLAACFEHFEIGNVDGGERAPPFEPESLELIAIAHVEHEERVAAVEPSQQVFRAPGFVEWFCHEGSPPCRDDYLGCGTTRK